MITLNFELNRKARKNGQYSIYLRATENTKHHKMVLDVYVTSLERFDPQARRGNWISTKERYSKVFNERLRDTLDKAEHIKNELDRRGELTAQTLIKILKRKNHDSFIEYIEEKQQQLTARKCYSTAHGKGEVKRILLEFNGGKDVSFNQINPMFVRDLVAFLRKKNLMESSIHEYIARFKTLYNQAKKEKIILFQMDPFEAIQVKNRVAKKEYLTPEEVNLIENLSLVKDSPLWHVRNYFLFAYYAAGMRISDVIGLKWMNIQDDHINYQMRKTKHWQVVRLLPQAKRILDLYKTANVQKDEYVFPIHSTYRPRLKGIEKQLIQDVEYNGYKVKGNTINKCLKKIIKKAGIDKNVSFHTARHSFATYAMKGNNVYMVSRLLGHTNIAVTSRYLHESSVIQDQYMENIFQNE